MADDKKKGWPIKQRANDMKKEMLVIRMIKAMASKKDKK